MNDYENSSMTDEVGAELEKARPTFQRVSSLRYSADPCRDELETTGARITKYTHTRLTRFI